MASLVRTVHPWSDPHPSAPAAVAFRATPTTAAARFSPAALRIVARFSSVQSTSSATFAPSIPWKNVSLLLFQLSGVFFRKDGSNTFCICSNNFVLLLPSFFSSLRVPHHELPQAFLSKRQLEPAHPHPSPQWSRREEQGFQCLYPLPPELPQRAALLPVLNGLLCFFC